MIKVWKHHISEHFKPIGDIPCHPNGGGKGGTVFLDYETMLQYLKNDGREWHIAELNVNESDIIRNPGNGQTATLLRGIYSDHGFKKLNF